LAAVGSLLLGAACSSSSGAAKVLATPHLSPLPPAAAKVINGPEYRHGHWNWDAIDLKTGKTVYAQNQNDLNFLGSTTKLFTVGTFFDQFGASSTLKTPVYAVGRRTAGALTGDLVLVGAGDFILGGRGVLSGHLQFHEPDHVYYYASPLVKPVAADPLAGLNVLAKQVKASGITSVRGDVLVNDKLWNPYETKEGVLTSLMVNDNLIDILVKPGVKAGDPVSLRTIPQTSFFTVVSRATTSAAGGQSTLTSTLGADNRIVVSGKLPLASPQQDVAVFAPDPAAYARALFIEALRRAGVTVTAPLAASTGKLPSADTLTPANKVASLTSPPVSVLAQLVLEVSHNRGAESLMCLLALKAGSKDCEAGLATMINTIAKAGIEPGSVFVYDGEGSDPASGTPSAVVHWLTWVDNQPWRKAFEDGLPDIAKNGKILVKSGLSARPENGKLPALFVAAGQAGFMTTQGGKRLAVALYALNASYPSVAVGLTKDLPATEFVLKQIQRAS
jgi:D-alanyl-D-alanine carboxypeptidase/D-alanyl-D-alanine-endopeptidase (penicillin-binding protein 4)